MLPDDKYRELVSQRPFGLQVARSGIDPLLIRGAKELLALLPNAEKHAAGSMIYMSSEGDRETYRAYAKMLVSYFWNRSPFPALYKSAFGLEPMLLVEFLTTRHHGLDPAPSFVGWHMDANFYGFIVPMLTAWVPLDSVGIERPSLDFIRIDGASTLDLVRLWQRVQQSISGRGPRIVEDDQVDALLADYRIERTTPAIDPGGYLLFDQIQLHRTQYLAAPQPRTAIEFRIGARHYRPLERPPEDFADMVVSTKDNGVIRIGPGRELLPEIIFP